MEKTRTTRNEFLGISKIDLRRRNFKSFRPANTFVGKHKKYKEEDWAYSDIFLGGAKTFFPNKTPQF